MYSIVQIDKVFNPGFDRKVTEYIMHHSLLCIGQQKHTNTTLRNESQRGAT